LPSGFAATRDALHLVAARVLGAARYGAVGRLGLVVVPGGFATPVFDGRQLLVVDGTLSDGSRQVPITTLDDACAFAGVDASSVPHPALDLPGDPRAPLTVDPASARVLAQWFGSCQSALDGLLDLAGPADDPSPVQLWPEHFDLALELGPPKTRANYGGSPGDETIETPYLYVGPHDHREGVFWNAPFGAALPYDDLGRGSDPLAFFQAGRDALLGS